MKGKINTFKENNKNTQLKGNLMMLVVTMLWGSSYLFMKMGLQTLQGFNIVALRFGIASIVAGAIFYKRLKQIDFKSIKYGFILGFILFMTMSTVTIAVKYTSVSNAGFLFSLAVVFVPLLLAVFERKKPEQKVIVGIGIALIGIALLTINSEFKVSLGDLLIISGALFYAIFIIVTDKVTKHVDSINLGILELGFAGAFALIFSFIFETPQLPSTSEGWMAILGLSIFCSAIGFIGQNIAQKYTPPTQAGLIFSLEPVFAALFAFMFFDEVLTKQGYIGAALVLIGVLFAKMDLKTFKFKKYTTKLPERFEN